MSTELFTECYMPLSYPYTIPVFSHKPIKPPRQGFNGELIFAACWQDLMAERPGEEHHNAELLNILGVGSMRVDQRCAEVAASFVCWLGTNIGKLFLEKGRALETVMAPGEGFLSAWAVHNRRVHHMSGGNRALELILDPTAATSPKPYHRASALTVKDYETVEYVAAWLGTGEGKSFVAHCEALVTRANAEDSLRHHLTNNLGLCVEDANKVAKRVQDVSEPIGPLVQP